LTIKSLTASLLLVIATVVSISAENQYTPLTPAQAKSWWNSQTEAQQLDFIVTADAVEHAVPVLPQPRYVAVLSGSNLYLDPYYTQGKLFDIMTLGPWSFDIKWKPIVLKDWYRPPGVNWTVIGVSFGVGAAVGIVAVVLISTLLK